MSDNVSDKSTFSVLVAMLTLLIATATLLVTLYKDRIFSHWPYGQAPVGLTYCKLEILPNEYRDQLTIHNI